MRIARFNYEDAPTYGVVEGPEGEEEITVIKGDPLHQGVNPTGETVKLEDVRLLAPVIPRSKIIGVGMNYAAHAREQGREPSKEPLLFFKPNTAVIGNGDPIRYPSYSEHVTYEGELAVVIGAMCKNVPQDKAKDVIFGYTIANDITARDVMATDGQWTRAKGFDGACPLGPWVETDIEDPQDLEIHTYLDGEEVQNANTDDMTHTVEDIVCFVSKVCTLLPGDVIITGSPAGIGKLEPGHNIEITIEKIGVLRNPVL